MTVSFSALLVFTIEPPETILQQGGSQKWKVDVPRARQCPFLVCAQNRNGAGVGDWAWCEPTEPDKAAFLIGHIDDVVPSDEPGRSLIKLRDYARIHIPDVWGRWRFPVRYTSLAELGINPTKLDFQPIPPPPKVEHRRLADPDAPPVTTTYNLPPGAGIELTITIRGIK